VAGPPLRDFKIRTKLSFTLICLNVAKLACIIAPITVFWRSGRSKLRASAREQGAVVSRIDQSTKFSDDLTESSTAIPLELVTGR
jgi:hypothetical protein